MKKIFYIIIFSILSLATPAKAETVLEIEPLFEYPVAPEELISLNERCNYLVKNFWNGFDFKRKQAVDQIALNDAFHVYASTIPYASAKEVNQSVDKLIKNISGNPVMLLQFCKAAEVNLYGPMADIWSDEVYLKFLDAVIKNKKIEEKRKLRYINQANALKESAVGNTAPTFWFQDKERASKQYFPMSTPTLLIFGDPEDTDWRLDRLRMDSNFKLAEAIDKGKINVLYIVTKPDNNWQNTVSNYNKKWTVGQSEDVVKEYDIRLNPSIFVVSTEGKIIQKNKSVDSSVNTVLGLIE
ncbi:MAG: DUF5106 domain-containing protein [Muribaculaceae bacterium]|nr:DUF5106 domain-containing protein [Muribaculaceae bacterium]